MEASDSLSDPFDELSKPGSIAFLIFICVLVLCTVFGNMITLLAVKVERAMQSVGYLFIAFKAVSDILLVVLVVPLAAIDDVLGYWPLSDRICEVWMAVDVTLVTVQILVLLALAVDRYIHMKYPTCYLKSMSRRTVVLVNLILWVVGSSAFGIPWSVDFHREGHRHDSLNRTICQPEYPPTMSFTFAALTFVVPSVAMLLIYRRLYAYSKRTAERFQLLFRTLLLNYPELEPKIPFQSEMRATVTIGLTTAAFVACWSPFFVAVMTRAVAPDFCCSRKVYLVVSWLGYSNCALSPIIYACYNATFRASFQKLLGLINEESYQRKVSCDFFEGSKRGSGGSGATAEQSGELDKSQHSVPLS